MRDVFHSKLTNESTVFCGKYEFPLLQRTDYVPAHLVSYEKHKNAISNKWLHFYIFDEKIECIWNNYTLSLIILKRFEGVITPDFSLYRDLPLAIQIYNVYRSRALGHWWQNNNIRVIPNIRWGDKRTYEFAFDGIQPGGTVAVGSLGGLKNSINRHYFLLGFDEMLKRIMPDTVVIYGGVPEQIRINCENTGAKFIQFNTQFQISHQKLEVF
jgi:hypothetical protein